MDPECKCKAADSENAPTVEAALTGDEARYYARVAMSMAEDMGGQLEAALAIFRACLASRRRT